MENLCFATFAKLIQTALQPPNGDREVVELLLDTIIDAGKLTNSKGNPICFSKGYISELLNRQNEVRRYIVGAASSEKMLLKVTHEFETKIIPQLNSVQKDSFFASLEQLINDDDSIDDTDKAKLISYNKDLAKFLTSTFFYAVNQANIIKKGSDTKIQSKSVADLTINKSHYFLLMEADGKCPLCGKQLVTKKNNKSLNKYSVIPIYPMNINKEEKGAWADIALPCKDLSSFDNQIALCPSCAVEYSSDTSIDEYLQLIDKKRSLAAAYAAWNNIDSIELEIQIEEVLRHIDKPTQTQMIPLEYNALKIKQKIKEDNIPLIIKVESLAIHYYKYLRELFNQLEDEGVLSFDEISMEVSLCYRKLSKYDLTQEEIFHQVVEWFKNKTASKHDTACEVIVAFFIQNCEVFDEITK